MRRLATHVLALLFPLTVGFVGVQTAVLIARGPTVATFDGTSCPAGVYTITALASDLAGHNYPSLPVTVTLPAAQVQVPWPNLPPGQYSALARAQHADGRAWNSEIVAVTGLGDPVPVPTPDPAPTPVPVPPPVPPSAPPTPQLPLPPGGQALLTSQVPTEVNATDHRAYELGVRLVSDVAGRVTALRYWKGSSETGTHVGHVWSADGQSLGSVPFSGETASGWQQQALPAAIAIAAGAEFVVSVTTGDNDFWVASDTYPPAGGHLHTVGLMPGRVGPVGSAPPVLSPSNYFRDLVFVVDAPPPTPGPTPAPDVTAILQAIQLSTDKVLAALAPPATVTCTVTAIAAYANADQKLTVRCPPSGIAVNQILKVIK